MSKSRGLGRGLGALIPQLEEEGIQSQVEIPIDEITPNPFQPRQNFDEESLNELAESIRNHGVLQPLLVRKIDSGYQLIAGERRLRASKLAGLATVPVIVRDFNDKTMMEIALVENLQREDLNPLEEAEAYRRLIEDFNLTQEEVAKAIGKSRSAVTNTLRLLNLPLSVQNRLLENKISMGHARALLALETPDLQIAACEEIINKSLSVRDTERLIRELSLTNVSRETSEKKLLKPGSFSNDPNIKVIIEKLTRFLGTKINIRGGGQSGKIEIEYYSREDLDRIIELLIDKT